MKTLIAILTTISATAIASPAHGPQFAHDVIAPGAVDTYRVDLRSNETTVFAVRGDGDGDIDCVVLDDNGNIVGADRDDTDSCLITVNPRWRAVFTLQIKNNGHIASEYHTSVR